MKEEYRFDIKCAESNLIKLCYQPRASVLLYVWTHINFTMAALLKLKLWHTSGIHYHVYDVQPNSALVR